MTLYNGIESILYHRLGHHTCPHLPFTCSQFSCTQRLSGLSLINLEDNPKTLMKCLFGSFEQMLNGLTVDQKEKAAG